VCKNKLYNIQLTYFDLICDIYVCTGLIWHAECDTDNNWSQYRMKKTEHSDAVLQVLTFSVILHPTVKGKNRTHL